MIETKNASLDTLAVTILALHVSGKQMTLAVFRQLPEGVENEESELWGVVRYDIKGCGDLWLVFSRDGILQRRAIVTGSRYVCRAIIRDLERDVANKERSAASMYATPQHIEQLAKAQRLLQDELKTVERLYTEDIERQNKEIQLSKLRQLFIAV